MHFKYLLISLLIFFVISTNIPAKNFYPISMKRVKNSVKVSLGKEKPFSPVKSESFLKQNSTILTDQSGRAKLKYKDAYEVLVKESTEVMILTNGFVMKVGNIQYRFLKKGKKFSIKTPVFLVGIYGTVLNVKVEEDGSGVVSVSEGEVSVKTKNSKVQVSAGWYAKISSAGLIKKFKSKLKKLIKLPEMIKKVQQVKLPTKKNVPPPKNIDPDSHELVDPKIFPIKKIILKIGDIDADGLITVTDIALLNQFLKGKIKFNDNEKKRADVNRDSQIDRKDKDCFKVYFEYSVDYNKDLLTNNDDYQFLEHELSSGSSYQKNYDLNNDDQFNKTDLILLKILLKKLKGNSINTPIQ